jgi:hypothetical protein
VFENKFDLTLLPGAKTGTLYSFNGILLSYAGQGVGGAVMRYECEGGAFGLLEDGVTTLLGNSAERGFGDSPRVHWTPGDDSKDGDKLTITMLVDGEPVDDATLIVRTDGYIYSLEEVYEPREIDENRYNLLTLEDVRRLAKLGDSLEAADFAGFAHSSGGDNKSEYHRYPIAGGKWELQINISYYEGEDTIESFWLIPSGFDFRPQGMTSLDKNVEKYIDLVESYTPELTKLTSKEEASALKAVRDYYEQTDLLRGEPVKPVRISDPAEFAGYVIADRVKGKLAAFWATDGEGPRRSIILTQTDGGAWEVINEGY